MPEIQQYAEAINLELLVQNLPKVLTSLKINSECLSQFCDNLRQFRRLARELSDVHECIDFLLLTWQPRLKSPAAHTGIQVIKDYGSVPQLRWNFAQLTPVLMTVLTLAFDALQESKASLLEITAKESNLEHLASNPELTLRICTQVDERNRVEIRINDYLIQLSLDSDRRPQAEGELNLLTSLASDHFQYPESKTLIL